MYKYHSQKQYGAPKIIDGWMVKFFPYDKEGKRNDLKKLEGGGNLPEEIVKLVKYLHFKRRGHLHSLALNLKTLHKKHTLFNIKSSCKYTLFKF
jgi:hypothetical protein